MPGNIIKVCKFFQIKIHVIRVQKYRKEKMNHITRGMNTILNLIYYNNTGYIIHI